MDYKEKVIALLDSQELSDEQKRKLEEIFPELKESEDERIKEELKAHIGLLCDGLFPQKKDWLAWIEKQGKQKSYVSETMNEKGDFDSGFTRMMEKEQNPAWSEEDELHIRELEGLVKQVWAIAEHENDKDTIHKMSDLSFFLKTLKPQPKQKWSEEDLSMIGRIRSIIEKYAFSQSAVDVNGELCEKEFIDADNWLKSLRPQSQWKPSKGQLECLGYAIEKAEKDWSPLTNNRIYLTLKALKEQLLELRGSKV